MGSRSKNTSEVSTKPTITEKVPLVPFKVIEAGIPFFRDRACSDPVHGASILILQTLDPEEEIQELDIVPTTLEYQKGDYVTLAFDNKRLWEDCYFRDPNTGEVSRAWRIHVNFIGEVIAPEAISREKSRIEDLEKRVEAKIQEIAQRTSAEPRIN